MCVCVRVRVCVLVLPGIFCINEIIFSNMYRVSYGGNFVTWLFKFQWKPEIRETQLLKWTSKHFLISESELRLGTEPPLRSKLWLADRMRRRGWLHDYCCCCYCSCPTTCACVPSCSNERPGKATILVYMYICPLKQDIIQNKLYVMYTPVFIPSLHTELFFNSSSSFFSFRSLSF